MKPICPNCGSGRFTVEQLTFNRQTWDTAEDRWSQSFDFDYELEYPLRAVCAECESDCTQTLKEHLDFYAEASLQKLGFAS